MIGRAVPSGRLVLTVCLYISQLPPARSQMILPSRTAYTCLRSNLLPYKLIHTALIRTTLRLSQPASREATMPPKTASQQVSSYDNKPDLMGASQQKKVGAAASSPQQAHPGRLTVNEVIGDIFDAPPNAVIIHACNCIGDWGAGIAAAFKKNYPSALKVHKDFCAYGPEGRAQIATAQLIPPVDGEARRHYVGCVFTSVHFGKKRDSPKAILRNTEPAIVDLLRQIAEVSKTNEVSEVRMCKINSGLFRVPWEKTLEVLQHIELEPGMPSTITIFERE